MKLGLVACSALLLAATTTFVPGCTSEETRYENAPGLIAFAPEARIEGASVFLRDRLDPLAPNHLVLDVVARGAADIHGAAFRVTWDPEALGFLEAAGGPSWSRTALAVAKEGAPGELAVAWAEKGEAGIDATGDTVLGTISFDVRSRKGTALAFRTERSQLVDKKGVRVDATWRGGSLPSR